MLSRTIRRLLRSLLFVARISSRRRRRTRFPCFAAVVRLRRDVCTADNLEKLALADRAYLLKLCGLLCGGTVPARLILGAFSTTSSYIPETVAPLRAAAAVVRRRAVTLHPAEGSSSGSSAAAGGGGAGAGGGVSTRDAPLFGRGFCTQSSRSGGSYTPPGRSWRTFRRWRQCFDPARQMRRRRMGSRATTSPSRRSCNIGSRSFESYGCTWRLFGLEIRAAGSCARRYPARLSRLFLGPGPGSCPWYRLPAAVCHIQCSGNGAPRLCGYAATYAQRTTPRSSLWLTARIC
jgi:hypothetical protein